MAPPSTAYVPRDPTASALHRIVRNQFETFRAHAAWLRDGDGLPRFVEQEFRAFLRCGFLAGGFVRFRCAGCGLDRLAACSCKGRGFCPSCGGRRMTERAAHLVDDVFPDVPVRQWVLSVPHRVRYQLAWDHDLCRAVVAVTMRAVPGWLRRRARLDGVTDGRGGAVAIVQRFGGALNLNVHVHALVMDGVFARDEAGTVAFHPAPRLTALDVAEVLATVELRIARLLDRRGPGDRDVPVGKTRGRPRHRSRRPGGGVGAGDRGARTASGRAHPASGRAARRGPVPRGRMGSISMRVARRTSSGIPSMFWDGWRCSRRGPGSI
ncbi:MAG: transposase zinc-binding domain-containing protein [Vicinamibacterales bacterium]